MHVELSDDDGPCAPKALDDERVRCGEGSPAYADARGRCGARHVDVVFDRKRYAIERTQRGAREVPPLRRSGLRQGLLAPDVNERHQGRVVLGDPLEVAPGDLGRRDVASGQLP